MEKEITYEELRHAYQIAARVVEKFGETYLPTFQRLHDELQKYEERKQEKEMWLNKAKEVASSLKE